MCGNLLAPVFVMAMNSLVIEREKAYLEKSFGRPTQATNPACGGGYESDLFFYP
jgi:hypothetical protein